MTSRCRASCLAIQFSVFAIGSNPVIRLSVDSRKRQAGKSGPIPRTRQISPLQQKFGPSLTEDSEIRLSESSDVRQHSWQV